jgi:hypothetical protein
MDEQTFGDEVSQGVLEVVFIVARKYLPRVLKGETLARVESENRAHVGQRAPCYAMAFPT